MATAEAAAPRYLAFVAFADADREWVEGYLLPALGVARESVLTRDDFLPGAPVVQEFERGVVQSSLTAVVLSRAFVADQWSSFGEQIASHAVVADGTSRLVPIVLDDAELPLHVQFRVSLDFRDRARWEAEAARLRDLLAQPPPAPETLACPYPGMVAFGAEDENLYFGREDEVADLARRLRHQRFLAVIGPSGSGKSSLVFAGLIPALAQGVGTSWPRRVLRPGATPVKALEEALGGTIADGAGAVERVREVAAGTPGADRLLVVVDQFEEVFTLAPAADRDRFLAAVNVLRRDESCVLVLTMRADFYPELMASEMWPLGEGERAELAPLRGDALRRAIVLPAGKVGVLVEPALVERVVADASGAPGALPLVQETMVLLWERRERRLLTLDAYESLGGDGRSGLAVAVETMAEATYGAMTPPEAATARRIFLRLVQLGEGRDDTRRQQSLDELRSLAADGDVFERTVRALTAHRLVTVSGDDEPGQVRTVDLAHETLITGWPRLRGWVDVDRVGLRLQRRLSQDADEWHGLGRDPKSASLWSGARLQAMDEWAVAHPGELTTTECDYLDASRVEARRELDEARHQVEQEHRNSRRLATLASGLAVLLVVAMVASLAAFRSSGVARRASNLAREANLLSTSRQLAAEAVANLAGRLDLSLLLASEAIRTKDTFEARNALLLALQQQPRPTYFQATGVVESMAMSRDGRWLAVVGGDGGVTLWDTGHPETPAIDLPGGQARAVAFSADGTTLAVGGTTGAIELRDVASGDRVGGPFGTGRPITKLVYSSSGDLAAAHEDVVVVWHPPSAREIGRSKTYDVVPDPVFSPDGRILAMRTGGAFSLWDIAEPAPDRPFASSRPGASFGGPPAFSPDGSLLALASTDEVFVWDAATRAPLPSIDIRGAATVLASVITNDNELITGYADGTMRRRGLGQLRRAAEGQPVLPRTDGPAPVGRGGPVTSLAVSDSGWLAAASGDSVVSIQALDATSVGRLRSGAWDRSAEVQWSVRRDVAVTITPRSVAVWRAGPTTSGMQSLDGVVTVKDAWLTPDGSGLALLDDRRRLTLWDLRDPGSPRSIPGPEGDITSVAFSPATNMLAWYDGDSLRQWDLAKPTRADRVLELPPFPIARLVFSTSGSTLGGEGTRRGVAFWRGGATEASEVVESPTFALSPDGSTVAYVEAAPTTDSSQVVVVRGVDDGLQLGRFSIESPRVHRFTFGPDGLLIVHASDIANPLHIRIRDVARDKWLDLGTGIGELITAADFSADGRLAVGTDRRTVIVWDLTRDRPVGTRVSHKGPVHDIAFSPDGRTLASVALQSGRPHFVGVPFPVILSDVATGRVLGRAFPESVTVEFSPEGDLLVEERPDLDLSMIESGVLRRQLLLMAPSWPALACEDAHHNLTQAEWDRYLGEGTDYKRTCAQYPSGTGAPPDAKAEPVTLR